VALAWAREYHIDEPHFVRWAALTIDAWRQDRPLLVWEGASGLPSHQNHFVAVNAEDGSAPIYAEPRLETRAQFLTRAREHWNARKLDEPHLRESIDNQSAIEWLIRHQVQAWTAEQIAEADQDADGLDASTVRTAVRKAARILGLQLRSARGRRNRNPSLIRIAR
jgi:hypothetical protein